MPVAQLPQEIIDLIIDEHSGSVALLVCLSLVSRKFVARTRVHLFRQLDIRGHKGRELVDVIDNQSSRNNILGNARSISINPGPNTLVFELFPKWLPFLHKVLPFAVNARSLRCEVVDFRSVFSRGRASGLPATVTFQNIHTLHLTTARFQRWVHLASWISLSPLLQELHLLDLLVDEEIHRVHTLPSYNVATLSSLLVDSSAHRFITRWMQPKNQHEEGTLVISGGELPLFGTVDLQRVHSHQDLNALMHSLGERVQRLVLSLSHDPDGEGVSLSTNTGLTHLELHYGGESSRRSNEAKGNLVAYLLKTLQTTPDLGEIEVFVSVHGSDLARIDWEAIAKALCRPELSGLRLVRVTLYGFRCSKAHARHVEGELGVIDYDQRTLEVIRYDEDSGDRYGRTPGAPRSPSTDWDSDS